MYSHPPSEDFFNRRLSESAQLRPLFWGEFPAGRQRLQVPLWSPPTATMALTQTPRPYFHSSYDQQGNSRSGQILTHLSFLDSFPHCDASRAHWPFVPLAPNQGLGPSTSHGWLGPVASSTLQSTASPSTRQFQGSGLPPALGRPTSKVDLYTQAKLILRQRTKGRENLLLLQRTDFIILPPILANDLSKRLHAPSSSLNGTLTSHSRPRAGGHFCYQCTGQWGCASAAAAKIWFSKLLPAQTKRGHSSFNARPGLRILFSTWLVSCPLLPTWGGPEACSERHGVEPEASSPPQHRKVYKSVQSPHVQRDVPLLPAT